MKRRALVAAWLLCSSIGAWAADTPGPAPTPDLTRVRLLDEAPNYARTLADQWSSGIRLDPIEVGRAGRNYGLLLEKGETRSISLEESIALAIKNNTGLKISYLDPISAAAGVRQARAIFDPQFFGNGSKTHSANQIQSQNPFIATGPRVFRDEVDFGAGVQKTLLSGGLLSLDWENQRIAQSRNVAFILRPYYQTRLNLSLNQPLLRGFGWRYTLLLVDVAKNTEEQALQQYRATLANLVKEVERAYWVFVLAIKNVKVEEQGLELARELLRQNEGRFNVGALPRTTVLEAQAEVAQREAQLVTANNLMQNARDTLRAVINARDPSSEEILMIEPSDAPTVVPYEVDLERSLKSASETRPELIAARLDVGGKHLQQKVAENEILPRLDLVGSIGVNGLGGDDKGPVTVGGTPIPPNQQVVGGYERSLEFLTDGRYYQYVAGARLEVPIANAQAKADYAQAKVNTERSWLSLHQLEENVTLEVKTAVSNISSDVKSIDATRIARELAEENLRNQKARYDVGLATTKDIVDYQDRLTQAQRQEIIALTRYNTDLAELRRVEGTLLDARNVVVEHPEPEKAPWWARF